MIGCMGSCLLLHIVQKLVPAIRPPDRSNIWSCSMLLYHTPPLMLPSTRKGPRTLWFTRPLQLLALKKSISQSVGLLFMGSCHITIVPVKTWNPGWLEEPGEWLFQWDGYKPSSRGFTSALSLKGPFLAPQVSGQKVLLQNWTELQIYSTFLLFIRLNEFLATMMSWSPISLRGGVQGSTPSWTVDLWRDIFWY